MHGRKAGAAPPGVPCQSPFNRPHSRRLPAGRLSASLGRKEQISGTQKQNPRQRKADQQAVCTPASPQSVDGAASAPGRGPNFPTPATCPKGTRTAACLGRKKQISGRQKQNPHQRKADQQAVCTRSPPLCRSGPCRQPMNGRIPLTGAASGHFLDEPEPGSAASRRTGI
jgi:hypothetical protein